MIQKRKSISEKKNKIYRIYVVPSKTSKSLSPNIKFQSSVNKPKSKRASWASNLKGMLQNLWERGCLDSNKSVRDYTINGKKINKESDEVVSSSSLKQFVKNLPDFKEKITLLQF